MSKLLEQINTAPRITKKLGDVIGYIADNRGKNPSYYVENGIPVIDNFMITGQRNVDLTSTKRFIDEKIYQEFIRKEIAENDILVTLVGNGFGQISLAPKQKSVIIQNTVGLRANDLSLNNYLFYLLGKYREKITGLDRGAAQPSVKVGDLLDIEIDLPDLPTQKKIAEILSAYDSKIENNNKIIKNLEATAQTIFNEWFINFRLPAPILRQAGFPDGKIKMVDSEMGEIPSGWEVKPLDEIAEFLNGVASQKYPAEDTNNSFPVIKIREMNSGIDKNSDQATKNIDSKYIIKNGDILFAWSGSLSLMTWVGGEGVLNQHIFKVMSENYPKWFIYYWTNKHLQSFKIIAEGKATTMGHIQRHHLTESKVVIPDELILKKADMILEPIFTQQVLLQEENISLKSQRDQLLAKLI